MVAFDAAYPIDLSAERGRKVARLEARKKVILDDMMGKIEFEDWHGVADAAMDLREIEAALKVLHAS